MNKLHVKIYIQDVAYEYFLKSKHLKNAIWPVHEQKTRPS